MLNPLRSEGEAFRFLLYVIASCVWCVVAMLIGRPSADSSRDGNTRAPV